MVRLAGLLLALALPFQAMAAEGPAVGDRVGDVYEITLRTETRSETAWGGKGSSTGGGALVERVVAVDGDGVDGDWVELEYDLPKDAGEAERTGQWQFPARVRRAADGTLTLLNRPELEARNSRWLEMAGVKAEACGRWYFTWTAFRIECDPQSALDIIAPFDLRLGPLADGGMYRDPAAAGPSRLRRETGGRGFVAEAAIDPEAVRREQAEGDVMLAQVTGKTAVTLEEALRGRAADRISGTVSIRLETDSAGQVTRVRVTTVEIVTAEGAESSTTTQTAERRLISRGP